MRLSVLFSLLVFGLLFSAANAQVEDGEPVNPLTWLQPKIEQWNAAINANDMDALTALYADSVDYYGKKTAKSAILSGKKAWLTKNAGYKQNLESYEVSTVTEGVEVAFQKMTVLAGTKKTFTAYLVFDPETNLIVVESDVTTDNNLAAKAKAEPLQDGPHCFSTTGMIWPEGAVPTFYETRYDLVLKGGKITGEGLNYSWGMRTMYTLKITGKVNTDQTITLNITSLGPMYPDDPDDTNHWSETRKFVGKKLHLSGVQADHGSELRKIPCNQ